MDLRQIGGVWPATLTPFSAAGVIDERALRSHFADVAQVRGVNAIVVNGHAGETTSLSPVERAEIVRVARSQLSQNIGVVAGVVAEDTKGACNIAIDAKAAGADALLLFPPSIFANGANLRPEMALRFVDAVVRASGLPIVLFQFSVSSGLGYSHEVLLRLCREVEAIIAVKEGSDVPRLFEANVRAIRELARPVTILTTNNTWLMGSLSLGVDGILSGMGSVAASLLVALFEATRSLDWSAARSVNNRLFPLSEVFYRPPYLDSHSRMKAALHMLGRLPSAFVRPPLFALPEADLAVIEAALRRSGIMDDVRRKQKRSAAAAGKVA